MDFLAFIDLGAKNWVRPKKRMTTFDVWFGFLPNFAVIQPNILITTTI